ncbi:MAG TPA: sigma 54-interacting transcriptional regulator [Polyangiaceae bacterium]|nr:sigma 54-interacting transcriptional regulator [Polyangiaceae bacterium]
MSFTTGAMQEFGAAGRAGRSLSGLVLLFAETFGALPPAFPFTRDRLVLGREPPADIVLPANAVSRVHAEVTWQGGHYVITDLNSRNGVLVNGRRVGQAALEPLDEVRIGDVLFKYVDQNAEFYALYRIDGSMIPSARRYAQNPTALVGGFQMDCMVTELERIAPSELNVLLLGPSGTGKEVVASELHRLSARPGPFTAVNCAAIPANLIESELFGFKRGAFSGADRDKPGIIRAAHRGTLLLDEIGDMPLDAQAKLLRVIQQKEVLPLGATQVERVDVRIVSATHRDLSRMQREGRFREDLFARLNEYKVRLPPLHERKEDIYALVRHFLRSLGRPDLMAGVPFMVALLHHDYPYNVRELEAAVKRAAALARGPQLEVDLLPDAIREALSDYGRAALAANDRSEVAAEAFAPVPSEEELRRRLTAHGGNVAAVGRELGKARMQIHRWMKRYGIEVDDYRG